MPGERGEEGGGRGEREGTERVLKRAGAVREMRLDVASEHVIGHVIRSERYLV